MVRKVNVIVDSSTCLSIGLADSNCPDLLSSARICFTAVNVRVVAYTSWPARTNANAILLEHERRFSLTDRAILLLRAVESEQTDS